MKNEIKLYYIYALCYQNGTPFYVGRSIQPDERFKSHLTEARRDSDLVKDTLIRELLDKNEPPIMRYLCTVETLEECVAKEIYWIGQFPDLVNGQHNPVKQMKGQLRVEMDETLLNACIDKSKRDKILLPVLIRRFLRQWTEDEIVLSESSNA